MLEKVFTSVLGIVINKMRDKAADSLKDGSVVSERFRAMIVRELKDVRVKLDALCYKDLKACIEFYETGIHRMYDYFKRCGNENSQTCANGQESRSKEQKISTLNSFSIFSLGNEAGAKGKDATKTLVRELVEAKKQFALAEEYATLAFMNDALKPFDRITAQKFRIASTILKNLDSPNTAASVVSCCKRYLQQLNDIPCVLELFAVEAESGLVAGIKRLLSQERGDIIEEVKAIHQSVFQFARHACLHDTEILRRWPNVLRTKEGEIIAVLPAFDMCFGHTDDYSYKDIAVNGEGEKAVIRKSLEVERFSSNNASINTFSVGSRGRAVTICYDDSDNIKVSTVFSGNQDAEGSLSLRSQELDVRTFKKTGEKLETIDCEGNLSTTLCDDQGDIFSLYAPVHVDFFSEFVQIKLEPHKGRYIVTTATLNATLKDILSNKKSETRTFFEKRGIALTEGVEPEHDVLVLGPLGKGLAVSTEFMRFQKIAWNATNGDIIFINCGELVFYIKDSNDPIKMSFGGKHLGTSGIAITPEGQIAVAGNNAIYVV